MDEPIVAIATSVGVSALNVIKLSGENVIENVLLRKGVFSSPFWIATQIQIKSNLLSFIVILSSKII